MPSEEKKTATDCSKAAAATIDNASKSKDKPTQSDLKEIVTSELERIGTGGKWVWSLFFLCVTPNILNGFHVSSYVFLGHLPADMWCGLEELQTTNWTTEQIRSITENGLNTHGCTIWNYNYTDLAKLSYDDAVTYTTSNVKPAEVLCKETPNSYFGFADGVSTFVPEYDLVCENAARRTNAQVALSMGKFFGSFSFGIFSDKYGRKTSFVLASVLYVLGSLITTFSPWYNLFLVGRLSLGSASSGLFYPAFALLSENICVRHRSWMSIAFAASYPIGMLILALGAYLIEPWRYLQLALTIPGFLLILNSYLLVESPRWLLTKDRVAEAYQIVFKKKCDIETEPAEFFAKKIEDEEKKTSFVESLKVPFKQLGALYGPPKLRRMALTCYFMWCVTSLCYYVTALNAHNLAVNRYLYVAITGLVDIPSLILPVILLRYTGRRTTASSLYGLAGSSLLAVLLIPQASTSWIVFFAMLGRFGISAVYSIVTLYTAELFPTEIRNSALGTCSTMAHVGSISAPYVVDMLGLLDWFIPTTICGCSIVLAGLLTFTLPETSKRNLTDHVEDVTEETKEERIK